MNFFSFILILVGVLLNAAAQLLLKAGTNAFPTLGLDRARPFWSVFAVLTEPHVCGGLTCYVISVGIWIAALSRVPVSVAYPMLSIGYVVSAVAAWWFFGEELAAQKLAGMGVIMVGVLLVARS